MLDEGPRVRGLIADRRSIGGLGWRGGGTTKQQPRSMRLLCQRIIAVGVWQACS